MNKYITSIFAIIALLLTSCDSDQPVDGMSWSVETPVPENIRYEILPANIARLNLEVDYKGGDITLICDNYSDLGPIGIDGSDTYDCGWGVFTVDGNKVRCHFPEDASGKEPVADQITIFAEKGDVVVNTILYVERSFGELIPDDDAGEVPDKYKFKLAEGTLMPFMNGDFSVPAPFDNLSYRITDYYDRFQVFFPEFVQYYDSIVWCADGFPDTERIYNRQNTATSAEEHFTSQWSTHFFKEGRVRSRLNGYRDGKVVYSSELDTDLYERDFLCYDWTAGSVVIANPGKDGIYCLLDKKYEYSAWHTQEKEGTRYAHIYVWNKYGLPDEELFPYQQEALKKLMAAGMGEAQSAVGKTGEFKCLPSEAFEATGFWENKTTRVLLLHQLPDEELLREKYYLHFEAK